MKSKELFVLLLLIIMLHFSPIFPDNINARIILTSAAHYYQYPNFDHLSPIIGFNIDADIFNIYNNFGIGGGTFLKIHSYNNKFQDLRYHEGYIHNFYNRTEDSKYFIYGFLGGIRNTYIYYLDREVDLKSELNMIRPLLGFHFSNESWGSTIKWTQTEKKKSKFEYDFKFRNHKGLMMQIGGSFKGPITGIKSDFHIFAGYEFIL